MDENSASGDDEIEYFSLCELFDIIKNSHKENDKSFRKKIKEKIVLIYNKYFWSK
jgi:energy-converting hydrogenase A subunit M